ncbi:MAG: hypothetical protein HKP42_12065, partial [Maribacter sp.]|nr:hypothetical protein [Maribacter sp.]
GYEGGRGGGMIVAEGTPEQVSRDNKSYTAKFLRKELQSSTKEKITESKK